MSSSTLALLAASDLPSSSQNDVANVATTALHLERYASELLLWLQRSDVAVPVDDALFFFETRHPELLDDLPLLFAWLSLFLAQHEDASGVKAAPIAARAMQQLDTSGDMAAVADQFALKSALTLLYWKHECDRQQLRAEENDAVETASSRPRAAFQDDKGLLQWVLSHRDVPLTRQDIVDHVMEEYPVFAASKSAAALKVWTARFLKKHIPPQSLLVSSSPTDTVQEVGGDVDTEAQLMPMETHQDAATGVAQVETTVTSPTPPQLPQSKCVEEAEAPVETQEVADEPSTQHTGKRRSGSGRYMLFSNEFKLHAVNMLDEGKSATQVAEELGLKNPNCLSYWRSIRDKLVTAERKRFRLAGGGRRSSCSFEDELLTWVSERHHHGQGTDVKAVLEYMKQYHSSFTEGKKEPTLRKWILRFFKRCWRAPSTSIDSQDAENRSREDAAETFNSLATMDAVPLVNRLHLSWQSVPATKQAKLYSPSTSQLPRAGNNRPSGLSSSNKQILSPIEPGKSAALSARKRWQSCSAGVTVFEQKDPLMRYVLHVIRTGSPVRRSEIPRGKHIQRRVRPEEDVLYLVPCEAPPCGFRNVYWLTFADEGTVLRVDHLASSLEYFTLGSHGLTRFIGGQGVEFSELAGWVDEKHAFDSMTNMKGLKRIQQMIFFFSWKRQAVRRRLHRVRERLASSLFTSHPIARQLLLNVRDVCAEIEHEAEREYVEADTSYTLERLAHIHRERVHEAKSAISKRIQALCGAIDDATRDISRYKEDQECSYAITDHEAFSKTLRLSSLRERMFTFLRVVDCHVAEAVYQHVALVVRDLRVRICGQPGAVQCVGAEERSGTLCGSGLSENASGQQVTYFIQTQESDKAVVAVPGLYVSLEDDVSFEGDVHAATMHFVPAKGEVLELVHTILMKYCVAMDGLPRVLTDRHFECVLTPFVPSTRRDFAASLLKPSHLVLGSYEPELRQMRAALELHFRRLGILQQEHLRCVRAIKVAERESPVETTRRNSITEIAEVDEEDGQLPELPDLSSSAAAYELAQKTWSRFVRYANSAAPMLQVGYVLLDQRSFVDRLRSHVSKRVAEMDDALPLIYQQFLASLLEDVDGRIEKITKIPTNLEEANAWLTQVTSMMPSRPFRQRLDTKIANLGRLRKLIKERGLVSLEPEVQDSIRKLELTWESVIETLLVCLAQVEERGSEHRRSVHDVITKVDEHISGQLQYIIKKFEEIPSGCEEEREDAGIPSSTDTSTKDDLVQQLEDLVAMDIERKSVVQQFEDYDREHRASMDMPPVQQPVWTSSLSSTSSEKLSAVSMTDKLPSELLLLYIITSLELRQWFESWKKMQDKWLGSPLTGVHPGTMINRIKQFRRRLGYASTRLSRLSSVLLQTLPLEQSPQHYEDEDHKECALFAKKDFELMRVFDSSIEEMSNCNRIFQAISGGAFSEARWTAMNQLLNMKNSGSNGGSHLTLRLMKEKCDAGQIEAFLDVCDECIVEAKLHVKLEQARQRLARIEVRVEETNYSVRCEGIAAALAQLDEIAVDVNLCLFGQNPELQLCLELRTDLEHKGAVCEHILSYQKHWRLRCEATKLHEMDEFFSKRFSGGDFAVSRGQKSHHKAGLKQEQSVWQTFLDTSHAWSDRLRRLFFVSPPQVKVDQVERNPRSLLGRKSTAASAPLTLNRRRNTATKSMGCTLDDVMKSFEGFDFEANFAACERGVELVRNYLNSIREKAPRMFCLDESSMLRLLLRDSDVQQLHQSLAICFPRVHRFAVSRAANRVGSTVEVFGKPEATPVRASKTVGTIVIMGIEGMQDNADTPEKSGHFRLPVAKIGRVKFWFTRLEEEMASMVLTDLKRGFEWATHDCDSSEFEDYDSLLPQSIATAFGLRFTFEMNQALRSDQHDAMCQQLQRLKVAARGRMDGLVVVRRVKKTISSSVRLENMLLLSKMQAEIVENVILLLEQGQQEDALFFWSMQCQTRIFVETTTTPNSTVQSSPGKHSKVERNELLPSSSDFLKATSSNHSGQPTSFSVCCQVAHVQMPLGQEFVGWGRLAVVSPFTQRCSYALFSALRMHHTALVVPYNVDRAGKDPTSLLWRISQLLLRPCIEFACDPSAGLTTVHQLGHLMNFTSKLNGFLIVRHLLQLSAALVKVVQEKMLQHFHQAAPAGNINPHYPQQQAVTNLLVLPRHPGGISYGASAIFVPLESTEELQRSGLVQSIRTQFRAVAVSRPAIKYIVECVLIADGFTPVEIRELNVVQAFEAIDARGAGSVGVFNVESLISRVIREARRLREQFRVVWDSNPLTEENKAMGGQFHVCTESSVASKMEIREGQCTFRQAFLSTIKTLSTEEQDKGGISIDLVNELLVRVFPLSTSGRLVTKSKGNEEAVAAAVTIYLESAYSLPTDCVQFELVMELWRALQTFPAALVYGSPGSGKTTCITALHRALVALEWSEQNQENEEVGRINSQAPSLTQLVILNPQLLTLDQFYRSIATACGTDDPVNWKQSSSSLKWVLVDGDVDGGQVVKYAILCQNVHSFMMRASPQAADPASQLDYFLSFLTNVAVTYRAKLQSRQKKILRLTTALETLAFARNKVVPTLERLKQQFELQCTQIDNELKEIYLQQEVEGQDNSVSNQNDSPVDEELTVDPEMEEAQWVLNSRYDELMMMNTETKLRLEEISRFLVEWHHVAERLKDLVTKWTQELDQEQCKTEHEVVGVAVYISALRAYPHVTSLPKRDTCLSLLSGLILDNIVYDSSPDIERRLVDASIDGSEDENIEVMRLIWTSRFSFLRNPDIYRTIRLADELCDRLSEASLVFILELDSSNATNEEDAKKKKVLAIAKQFKAMLGGDTRGNDWHGAVLRHSDGGVESWGIRVEGLVLVSATRLHPLPVCRIMCQQRVDTLTEVEATLVLLPSLSPYQPALAIPQEAAISDTAVRIVLGRSINSVVDMEGSETMHFAVGVPVFPDDDSNDTS
ncbi:hypothetical protein JG688_00000844 [Phytophthora aleatoria]|uniref:Uncharacterized protein n=1 Tax=Phytophthora aleatoria TaxID=2496075 RepID=A0A8J5J5T1_9STRA|nr:hypothetical protein JG688_00000844 [Phytophthora aleatoria]